MPQTLNSILMLFVFKHTGSLSKSKQPGPLLTLRGAIRWGSGKKEVKKRACVSVVQLCPRREDRNLGQADEGFRTWHGVPVGTEREGASSPPRAGPLFCGLQKFPLLLCETGDPQL